MSRAAGMTGKQQGLVLCPGTSAIWETTPLLGPVSRPRLSVLSGFPSALGHQTCPWLCSTPGHGSWGRLPLTHSSNGDQCYSYNQLNPHQNDNTFHLMSSHWKSSWSWQFPVLRQPLTIQKKQTKCPYATEEKEQKQVCFVPFNYYPLQLHKEEQQAESSVVLCFFNLNSSFL